MQTPTSIAVQSMPELQPIMQQQQSQPNMPILRLLTFSYRLSLKLRVHAQAIELTQEIDRRTTTVIGNPLETIHLFQRLSIARCHTAGKCSFFYEHVQI